MELFQSGGVVAWYSTVPRVRVQSIPGGRQGDVMQEQNQSKSGRAGCLIRAQNGEGASGPAGRWITSSGAKDAITKAVTVASPRSTLLEEKK